MIARLTIIAVVFLGLAIPAFSHQLDECLQATLVDITPEAIWLEVNLTPGVAVAEQVLAMIDLNHDGVISANEAAAYAELLKRDLLIRLDERDVRLNVVTTNFPDPAEIRDGMGIIQVEYSLSPGHFSVDTHRLTFDNRHLPATSVYLFNAAKPASAAVEITAQKRIQNQSAGEIDFSIHAPVSFSKAITIVGSLAAVVVAALAGMWWMRKISPSSEVSAMDQSRQDFETKNEKPALLKNDMNFLTQTKTSTTKPPMKNNTYLKLGIAAICTFTTISTIRAQDGPPQSGGPGERGGPGGPGGEGRGGGLGRRNPFLTIFDTNGDGVLDENEMSNATAALKKLDKNGDGKVTDDELRAVMPGRGQGGPGGPGGGGAINVDQMVNDLMKFDANGDGKISKEELPDRMKSMMDRGDTDKDGFLSKDEIQKLFQSQNNAGNRGGGERDR